MLVGNATLRLGQLRNRVESENFCKYLLDIG